MNEVLARTDPKDSFTLVVSDSSANIQTTFNPPLYLQANRATLHYTTVKQSVMGLPLQKPGLATCLRKIRASVISSTCTRFLKFSCVFPKTLLFINMKKSVKKLFPANQPWRLFKCQHSVRIGDYKTQLEV